MFAQANSEHCRHKIFNADWWIDGARQPKSLFAMIRHTHAANPRGTVVAYADNAAVMEGATVRRFYPDAGGRYAAHAEPTHILMKVETHNHPTAIAPFPGAATGSGGEIRDEGATGRGAKPKAGLTGFTTSHLRIPGLPQPWEKQLTASLSASHRRSTSCSRGRSAARRSTTSSAGRICSATSARSSRKSRRGARLSQADHDRRRRGQHPRRAHARSTRCRTARCSSSSAARAC